MVGGVKAACLCSVRLFAIQAMFSGKVRFEVFPVFV
jgi:hypothetical protein